ncbi:unnamed protein product [Gadus morhua 'NCC']
MLKEPPAEEGNTFYRYGHEEGNTLYRYGHEEGNTFYRYGHEEGNTFYRYGHEEGNTFYRYGHEEGNTLYRYGHEEGNTFYRYGHEDGEHVFYRYGHEEGNTFYRYGHEEGNTRSTGRPVMWRPWRLQCSEAQRVRSSLSSQGGPVRAFVGLTRCIFGGPPPPLRQGPGPVLKRQPPRTGNPTTVSNVWSRSTRGPLLWTGGPLRVGVTTVLPL